MVKSKERDSLYRILWIACREALLRENVTSDDAIRARRGWVCYEVTMQSRGADQATEDYASLSVIELREAVRRANPTRLQVQYASEQARANLMYHAMLCSIHFIDLEDRQYVSDGGIRVGGEALRAVLWSLFQRRETMPNNLFLLLCNGWINQTCNRYLAEAGLRSPARKPDEFRVRSLTAFECHELTKRFKQIARNLPPAPVAQVADMSTN